jgi:hypothetical protein
MKTLHAGKPADRPGGLSRREFIIAGALGLAALAAGCAGPRANAPVRDRYYDFSDSVVEMNGRRIKAYNLPKTMREMAALSEPLKEAEENKNGRHQIAYQVPVSVSGSLILFRNRLSKKELDALAPDVREELYSKGSTVVQIKDMDIKIGMIWDKNGESQRFMVTFPGQFDPYPTNPQIPGLRTYDLKEFSGFVKSVTGADYGIAAMLVDHTPERLVIHVVPVDSEKRAVSACRGGILAYSVSFRLDNFNPIKTWDNGISLLRGG